MYFSCPYCPGEGLRKYLFWWRQNLIHSLYISNIERLSSRKRRWIHPSRCMRWVSSAAPAKAFLLLFCIFPWSAPSSYSQASVCLLRRAIRDLCRWLRRTYERLLISWCVKTFCQADSASERLGFWCVNRDFLITQVMSISVTCSQKINHFLKSLGSVA